ncbi:MAG: hypothetical protein D6E12_06450 [Desulfovibrio sp.]|nr:MAG: hypothetical protein D6E12_06450 [Desulfovibrio sp.]
MRTLKLTALAAPMLSLGLCLVTGPALAGIYPEIWEKYYHLYELEHPEAVDTLTDSEIADGIFPGQILGEWDEPPLDLFQTPWPQRENTFEILAASSRDLARCIYGLALFTHDLDESISLERFERGAQGFHYSTDQIVDWANAVLSGEFPLYTTEELWFLGWLCEQNVLVVDEGDIASSGILGHILGASSGPHRSMALNLNHERLHVLWDESLPFNMEWHARWEELSDEQRQAVFEDLSGYDQDNIEGIIEEWSVRQNEAEAVW